MPKELAKSSNSKNLKSAGERDKVGDQVDPPSAFTRVSLLGHGTCQLVPGELLVSVVMRGVL